MFEGSVASFASDVYAYAMTIIEIWQNGEKPWPTFKNNDVVHAVKKGQRPIEADNFPKGIYVILEECWHQSAAQRPTFEEIINKISQIKLD